MVKRRDTADDWAVWHRSIGATKYLQANLDDAQADLNTIWNDTEPTSTNFTVGVNGKTNTNGSTYVAYIFAHDDQSYGTDSDEAIIKCGTYESSSSAGTQINLGFEPQFLLIKNVDTSGADWVLYDNMRGLPVGENDQHLNANATSAENHYGNVIELEATGFKLGNSAPFVSPGILEQQHIRLHGNPPFIQAADCWNGCFCCSRWS